jgi:hypothetical protein
MVTANRSDVERFEEIIGEMADLLEEAERITRRNADIFAQNRAKAYWVGAIENGLSAIGGNADMQETLVHMQENLPNDDLDSGR